MHDNSERTRAGEGTAVPEPRRAPVGDLLEAIDVAGGELVNRGGELCWVCVPSADVRDALEARIRAVYWRIVTELTPRCVGCRKAYVDIPGTACVTCRGSRPHAGVIGFGGGVITEHAIVTRRAWLCGAGVLNEGDPFHPMPPITGAANRRRLCARCACEMELRDSWHSVRCRGRVPSGWWR